MSDKQRTIKKSVTLSGKGLHTGYAVDLTFQPAPENHGIKFQRIDLDERPIIPASVDKVVDTSRGTTLEERGVKVHTIEHVMASLVGLGIDNVLLEVSGPEMPIMDGSSKLIVEALKKAGTVEQEADRDYYYIKEPTAYRDEQNGIELIAYPDDGFSINVLIDYDSKVLGNQYAYYDTSTDFEKEIAPCRTFVFFHELEFLRKNNLIKGGDLANAIVIMEKKVEQEELDRMADLFDKPHVKVKPEGILSNIDLRFGNEPARHKLLDIMGDLALVGKPIKGRILAMRPGHYANTQFAGIVKDLIKKETTRVDVPEYDPNQEPVFDINQIKQMLPHRPPFLLVDKIVEMEDKHVVGVKNVTMNEGFFVGHFPEEPVMPGVLQVEAMAQVGGLLILNMVDEPEKYTTYFLRIDKVRFKRKVVPGDTIVFRLALTAPFRRGIAVMMGQGFVGDNLVIEGELMAQVVKNK